MNQLVSIIIPTFNRDYILAKTIQTVIAQTYTNWELVIVDDGSTDNTKTIVAELADKRIHYYYQPNAGQSAARNKGCKLAQGDWIAYLDSDNELLPNYLATMLAWIQQYPSILYALPKGYRTLELFQGDTRIKTIDDSNDFPNTLTVKDIFLRKLHLDTNGLMHSSAIITQAIRWDEQLHRMEDWDFVMQLGECYPDKFLYVPERLVHYHQRYGQDGLVANTSYQQWADTFEYIYQKHRNATQLHGQTWYPARVKKFEKLERDWRAGRAPAPQLRYFI